MKTITQRFVLHLGYSCNERCRFCYYRDSLENNSVKDLSTNEIKKRLISGRRYKKEAIDLSGGEPTIRKDLPEIIQYAKSIGYKTICVITNGIAMARKEKCKMYIKCGLNDVLFSLHSAREDLHDYLTRTSGSWKKLNLAMKNLQELGTNFRINTVVNNLNYNDMDNYFQFIKQYHPKTINLLIYNSAEECGTCNDDNIHITDYQPVSNSVIEALNKYSGDFEQINVRFMPFCLLKGHEDKIRTMWQKIYESEEWDPVLFMKFRKNNFFLFMGFVLGLFVSPFKQPYYGKKSIYTWICEIVQNGRIFYNNQQTKECKSCSLRKICPGISRGYIKKYPVHVEPYDGTVVKDPIFFCKNNKSFVCN